MLDIFDVRQCLAEGHDLAAAPPASPGYVPVFDDNHGLAAFFIASTRSRSSFCTDRAIFWLAVVTAASNAALPSAVRLMFE
jgi:hypothetical protein